MRTLKGLVRKFAARNRQTSRSQVYVLADPVPVIKVRVVAHRLSTVARMDQLAVLDHGRLVEAGTHSELLRLGGTYARLWQHQSGGFLEEDEDPAVAEGLSA
jgi:hypothetical protein